MRQPLARETAQAAGRAARRRLARAGQPDSGVRVIHIRRREHGAGAPGRQPRREALPRPVVGRRALAHVLVRPRAAPPRGPVDRSLTRWPRRQAGPRHRASAGVGPVNPSLRPGTPGPPCGTCPVCDPQAARRPDRPGCPAPVPAPQWPAFPVQLPATAPLRRNRRRAARAGRAQPRSRRGHGAPGGGSCVTSAGAATGPHQARPRRLLCAGIPPRPGAGPRCGGARRTRLVPGPPEAGQPGSSCRCCLCGLAGVVSPGSCWREHRRRGGGLR